MNKLFIIFVSFICLKAEAQIWLQYGDDIECPDALEISQPNYTILNDCYGLDRQKPIIETGIVEFEGEYISFLKRKVLQRSFLQGDAKSQKLMIIKKSSTELHLKDGSNSFRFKISNVPQ